MYDNLNMDKLHSGLLPDLKSGLGSPVQFWPIFIASLLAYAVYALSRTKSNVPLLNPKGFFEITETRLKKEFLFGAKEMLGSWFAENNEKPVRMITDLGMMTIISPKFANEIRNDSRLDFSKWVYTAFHAHTPGFEGFREGMQDSHLLQQVVQKHLTKYVNTVTEPLSDETAANLPELFGESTDWHAIPFNDTVLELAARISSRIFLGEELCRNKSWLRVSLEYTIDVFTAADELRTWPRPLWPIVHWFLPHCKKARALVQEARSIIDPVLQARRAEKAVASRDGAAVRRFHDAIEWFEHTADGTTYDPATAQLMLALVAIRTTTDLICKTLFDLVQHPDIIAALREEMRDALAAGGGWQKASLYNMKLLDSAIKETQRLRPATLIMMRRLALEDITLSDGTVVPKGQALAVSDHCMWDPAVYEDAARWDGYRFARMRTDEPSKAHVAQLASTSPEHLGFGHGQHACPGRFFASNMVKIVLTHLLLAYDFRLPAGQTPQDQLSGINLNSDPVIEMECRLRKVEK